MSRELPAYHRKIAAENRTAILDSATDLFLELGYDRTSLARVADRAGVSKATLFKQFPTKAELFEATVLAAGGAPGSEPMDPPPGTSTQAWSVSASCTPSFCPGPESRT